MVEKKKYSGAFLRKFVYALRGLKTSLKEEKSLVIHCVMAFIAIITSAILQLGTTQWAIIVILIGVVISSEIINTAIENLADMVAFRFNFNAKKIKDVSAAATLTLVIFATIVGLLIFIPRIVLFAKHGYGYMGWQN